MKQEIEAMMTKKPKRAVPQLKSGQIAFHGGLTANKELFSLEAVLARHAGAVRLRPLAEVADATINSTQDLHVASEDAATPSNLEPKDASKT